MKLEELETEVLALPLDERAALARRLLWSLEDISEKEFDRLWGNESARRAGELVRGVAQIVPGDEVAEKARLLLR